MEGVSLGFTPFKNKVWLSSPTMHGDELKYMKQAYDTNWMSTLGENLNQIEKLICEKVGCNCAVPLASGTSALHMAVKLAGIKQGEKVFCTDMTFGATVNPVVYEGGVPVFIDTERDTWNMSPVALEKAFEIFPEVRVVVVAHLYGIKILIVIFLFQLEMLECGSILWKNLFAMKNLYRFLFIRILLLLKMCQLMSEQ